MTPTERILYNALIECQRYFRQERDNQDGELETIIDSALMTGRAPHQVPGQTFLF